jgi:TM2 domain-containing membrane protein YozV
LARPRKSEPASCSATAGQGEASPDPVDATMYGSMTNPGTAAVLSAIIPGIGQFYNGDFLRGIFWLIITPGMWIGTGGLLGWVCHVIAAVTAYNRGAKKIAA